MADNDLADIAADGMADNDLADSVADSAANGTADSDGTANAGTDAIPVGSAKDSCTVVTTAHKATNDQCSDKVARIGG